MKQSKHITKFYKAYYSWVKAGAPKNNKYDFKRWVGLCANVSTYTDKKNWDGLRGELSSQFEKAKMNTMYPFGEHNYDECYQNDTQYKDKNRIRWVKKHCKRNVKKSFKLK